jgi:hypothetical protein
VALPNFIGVGAEKAGTSPLALVLVQHRDVFIAPTKETHFFSRFYDRAGLLTYETSHFRGHCLEKAIGELTPEYMRFREVPGRLRECLGPDLRLIFCLRDPVARAFSHYLQCVRLLQENESFESAVALEPVRIADDYYAGMRRAYVGGSLYAAQIARFREHFPPENMFFMVLEEDFVGNRERTVARLFDFLGVGADPRVKLDVRNTGLAAPRVEFVTAEQRIRYSAKGRSCRLPAGAILFTTGNDGSDRVIARPSAAVAEFFRALEARMTRELPEEFAAALYRAHFKDEISRVENLIGRDLSVWRR